MESNGKRRKSIGKWARRLAVAIPVVGIIYLLLWYVPDALVRRNANSSVESAWISAVAGFLGVVATAAVAIFAFWYSRSTNQATIAAAKDTTDETLKTARETNQATIDAAREAQFADRYSKAVEQLGSDNPDVRIGGIYALERVAEDSPRDHPTVMEVLASFIRERSQVPASGETSLEPERTVRPDVQVALTVIRRRDASYDRQPIDLPGVNLAGAELSEADLPAADLTGADLAGVDLSGAELTEAHLPGADLTGADLTGVDLTGADLTSTFLRGTQLRQADLTDCDLSDADLTQADLVRAKLSAAFLTDANLTGARLSEADLNGADLNGANLTGANLGGAKLTNSDLTGARLIRANLTGTDLHRTNFTDADLADAQWPEEFPAPTGWVRSPHTGLLSRVDGDGDDSGD